MSLSVRDYSVADHSADGPVCGEPGGLTRPRVLAEAAAAFGGSPAPVDGAQIRSWVRWRDESFAPAAGADPAADSAPLEGPGDDFTMLEAHAASVAAAIDSWLLAGAHTPQEQSR